MPPKTANITEQITDLRQQAAERRREAAQLVAEADELERTERRRANAERREAERAALRANPTAHLVVGGVEEVRNESRDGSVVQVHEVEMLYERSRGGGMKQHPVAQRWPSGEVHWLRTPSYLSKAGISVMADLFDDRKKIQKQPTIRRLRSFLTQGGATR